MSTRCDHSPQVERNAGSTLADRGEPGIRVYKVIPEPLEFDSFLGFYRFEAGAGAIADASPIPGSTSKIAVIERAGWPSGQLLPGQACTPRPQQTLAGCCTPR